MAERAHPNHVQLWETSQHQPLVTVRQQKLAAVQKATPSRGGAIYTHQPPEISRTELLVVAATYILSGGPDLWGVVKIGTITPWRVRSE